MLESLGKRRISEGIIGLFGLGCFLQSDRKEEGEWLKCGILEKDGKRKTTEDYGRLSQ